MNWLKQLLILYWLKPVWISTKDRLPEPGDLIVKRWSKGTVWAGIYTGTSKESSFDYWYPLPT